MRLFTKYFLVGMLVLGLTFSVSGYFLLHYSMESSLAREADFALKQYQYDKFTVQSAMLTYSDVTVWMRDEDGLVSGDERVFSMWGFFSEGSPLKEAYVLPGSAEVEGSGAAGEPAVSGILVPKEGGAAREGTVGSEERKYSERESAAEKEEILMLPKESKDEDASGNECGTEGAEALPDAELQQEEQELLEKLVTSLFGGLAGKISVPAAFYAEDGTLIYSEIEGVDASFLGGLTEDAHVYQFCESPEGGAVLVGSVLYFDNLDSIKEILGETYLTGSRWASVADGWALAEDEPASTADEPALAEDELASTAGGWASAKDEPTPGAEQPGVLGGLQKVYFVTQWDISKTIRQQQTLRAYFIRGYLVAMGAGMVLLGFLSALLTGPLKRMSKAAGRMAEGDYEVRLAISGRDEIGELAGSFNRMADAVEEKIGELSQAAREKEDFVANFAHELKTPLTSIIGYADTIYQKELSRDEVRKASWNIWNEGMRLEALSFKLMELTVLGRQEFPLVEMPADELLRDVAESLAPVMEEKQIVFQLQAQAAYVRVDYDLLKTLLINLVDNSVKAGAKQIALYGEAGIKTEQAGWDNAVKDGAESGGADENGTEEMYRICVRDDGCGMEEEVLSRITEAFYMVDKARSRRQHGAGLGLALADRIARVHGSTLVFRSRKGQGTEVSFSLKCEKDMAEEGED